MVKNFYKNNSDEFSFNLLGDIYFHMQEKHKKIIKKKIYSNYSEILRGQLEIFYELELDNISYEEQ